MVSTISRRERIHQTTLNCNITPNISFDLAATVSRRENGRLRGSMLRCLLSNSKVSGGPKSREAEDYSVLENDFRRSL